MTKAYGITIPTSPRLLRRALVGVSFTILLPSSAAAYCRQKTCEDVECPASAVDCEPRSCAKDAHRCIIEGDDLYYPSTCIKFAVEKGAGKDVNLSDAAFEAAIEEAFERWRSVDCGDGKHPGFVVQSAGVVATTGNFFCTALPEVNVSVWRLSETCPDDTDVNDPTCWGHGNSSLGFTTSTYAVETGEIFDADVEFNRDRILTTFPTAILEEVVIGIATHEAGHFLGLAHSDERDAIMAAAYTDASVRSREFHQDDIDGICAIFPPEGAPNKCSPPSVAEAALFDDACEEAAQAPDEDGTGCSVAVAPVRGPLDWSWVVLLGGVLVVRRRK